MKYSALLSPPSDSLKFPANTRLLSEERVVRITTDNMAMLSLYLQNHTAEDPYLLSPAYYAMTGRNGLWLYRGETSRIIFCRHPNVENKYLIFPIIRLGDDDGLNDLSAFIKDYAHDLDDFQFFRFSQDQAQALADKMNADHPAWSFIIEPEKILDTTFPTHIISTHNLTRPNMPEMRYYRRRMNKIESADIKILDIHQPDAKAMAREVFRQWDEAGSQYADYLVHYTGTGLHTDGFCMLYQGQPSGVALWDIRDGTASALVTISNTSIPGMSAYLYHEMGRVLGADNVPHICLGGSEDEGLDFFKRKLNPLRSVSLVSVQATAKTSLSVSHSRKIAA
jgi:hypothetical protein